MVSAVDVVVVRQMAAGAADAAALTQHARSVAMYCRQLTLETLATPVNTTDRTPAATDVWQGTGQPPRTVLDWRQLRRTVRGALVATFGSDPPGAGTSQPTAHVWSTTVPLSWTASPSVPDAWDRREVWVSLWQAHWLLDTILTPPSANASTTGAPATSYPPEVDALLDDGLLLRLMLRWIAGWNLAPSRLPLPSLSASYAPSLPVTPSSATSSPSPRTKPVEDGGGRSGAARAPSLTSATAGPKNRSWMVARIRSILEWTRRCSVSSLFRHKDDDALRERLLHLLHQDQAMCRQSDVKALSAWLRSKGTTSPSSSRPPVDPTSTTRIRPVWSVAAAAPSPDTAEPWSFPPACLVVPAVGPVVVSPPSTAASASSTLVYEPRLSSRRSSTRRPHAMTPSSLAPILRAHFGEAVGLPPFPSPSSAVVPGPMPTRCSPVSRAPGARSPLLVRYLTPASVERSIESTTTGRSTTATTTAPATTSSGPPDVAVAATTVSPVRAADLLTASSAVDTDDAPRRPLQVLQLLPPADPSHYGAVGDYLHQHLGEEILQNLSEVDQCLGASSTFPWPKWDRAQELERLSPPPFLKYTCLRFRFVHWVRRLVDESTCSLSVFTMQYVLRTLAYTVFSNDPRDVPLFQLCTRLLRDMVFTPSVRQRLLVQVDGIPAHLLVTCAMRVRQTPERMSTACLVTGRSLADSVIVIWRWCWWIGLVSSDAGKTLLSPASRPTRGTPATVHRLRTAPTVAPCATATPLDASRAAVGGNVASNRPGVVDEPPTARDGRAGVGGSARGAPSTRSILVSNDLVGCGTSTTNPLATVMRAVGTRATHPPSATVAVDSSATSAPDSHAREPERTDTSLEECARIVAEWTQGGVRRSAGGSSGVSRPGAAAIMLCLEQWAYDPRVLALLADVATSMRDLRHAWTEPSESQWWSQMVELLRVIPKTIQRAHLRQLYLPVVDPSTMPHPPSSAASDSDKPSPAGRSKPRVATVLVPIDEPSTDTRTEPLPVHSRLYADLALEAARITRCHTMLREATELATDSFVEGLERQGTRARDAEARVRLLEHQLADASVTIIRLREREPMRQQRLPSPLLPPPVVSTRTLSLSSGSSSSSSAPPPGAAADANAMPAPSRLKRPRSPSPVQGTVSALHHPESHVSSSAAVAAPSTVPRTSVRESQPPTKRRRVIQMPSAERPSNLAAADATVSRPASSAVS